MARARGSGAGGIEGLVALINQHGEALDADLQHFYPGRSLADLVAGRMTFRQLHVLIKGLPGDGTAMWRDSRRNMAKDAKTSPPPDDFWTPERDLLASAIDLLAVQVWQSTQDGHKGRNMPEPIRRPGIKQSGSHRGTPMSAAQVRARLRPDVREGDEPGDEPDGPQDTEGDTPPGER